MTRSGIDWKKVRAQLVPDRWLFVGRVRRSTYEAVRSGRVTSMDGAVVTCRRRSADIDGVLWVDLYAKLREENTDGAAAGDAGGSADP